MRTGLSGFKRLSGVSGPSDNPGPKDSIPRNALLWPSGMPDLWPDGTYMLWPSPPGNALLWPDGQVDLWPDNTLLLWPT